MDKLLCILGLHEYEPLRVYHYWDTSWGNYSASTTVTLICKHCKQVQKKDMYGVGFIELEELK